MPTLWSQRLELVKEEDARGGTGGPGEHVAHGLLTGPNVFAQELWAFDAAVVSRKLISPTFDV